MAGWVLASQYAAPLPCYSLLRSTSAAIYPNASHWLPSSTCRNTCTAGSVLPLWKCQLPIPYPTVALVNASAATAQECLRRDLPFLHQEQPVIAVVLDDVHVRVDGLKHLASFIIPTEAAKGHIKPV